MGSEMCIRDSNISYSNPDWPKRAKSRFTQSCFVRRTDTMWLGVAATRGSKSMTQEILMERNVNTVPAVIYFFKEIRPGLHRISKSLIHSISSHKV